MQTKQIMQRKGMINPTIILFVIAAGAILYFGVFRPGSLIFNSGCQGGAWNIDSYDPTSQTATIHISATEGQNDASICLNSYQQKNPGINNQLYCESFGLTWNPGDKTCTADSQRWIQDKDVSYNVYCTHAVCAANGFVRFATCTDKTDPGFDGVNIQYGDLHRQGEDSISCSGTITVKPKTATQMTAQPVQTLPPASNTPVYNTPASQTSTTPGFFDWITNLFSSIFSGIMRLFK